MASSSTDAGPKKGGKRRKAASFSGRPLAMGDIAEELEGHDLISARQQLQQDQNGSAHLMAVLLGEKTRWRPHKSTGDDSAYLTATSSTSGSNSSELDDDDDDDDHLRREEPTKEDAPAFELVPLTSLAYPAVSVVNSNRRLLGRRRIGVGAQAADAVEVKDAQAPFDGPEMKRIPSSLFYFRYEPEEEDDFNGATSAGRRRISRSNIPTSRKFSAASNYSFFEDEDDDDEDEEEEEVEEWEEEKGRQEVGVVEDGNLKEGKEESLTEERILNDRQKLSETSTDLYRQTLQQVIANS